MKSSVYLTFDRQRIIGTTKNAPTLSSGEFAVKLNLEVNDKFFTQIIPVVDVKIGDQFVITPEVNVEPEKPTPFKKK